MCDAIAELCDFEREGGEGQVLEGGGEAGGGYGLGGHRGRGDGQVVGAVVDDCGEVVGGVFVDRGGQQTC